MINCNPETVSTDYDTSDRLYFEPLTFEDVLGDPRQREAGRRPRAVRRPDAVEARAPLEAAGFPICGTSARRRSTSPRTASASARSSDGLGLAAPAHAEARPESRGAGRRRARIGYPLIVRPSYVLGGRAMAVVFDDTTSSPSTWSGRARLARAPVCSSTVSSTTLSSSTSTASDGTDVWIGGVQQHIEEAGIHSGDSSRCSPWKISPADLAAIKDATRRARARPRRPGAQ